MIKVNRKLQQYNLGNNSYGPEFSEINYKSLTVPHKKYNQPRCFLKAMEIQNVWQKKLQIKGFFKKLMENVCHEKATHGFQKKYIVFPTATMRHDFYHSKY